MKHWFRAAALLLCLALLTGCGAGKTALPEPGALAERLLAAASDGPEMAAMPADYLREQTGLKPEDYESAAYYVPSSATAPDEWILVKCKDADAAAAVRTKLENRLAMKEQAAQVYLTEQLPTIRAGVVRTDGLTVSLLVSEKLDALLKVYESFG